PFDNSSMDGYAVRVADVAGASEEFPAVLTVIRNSRIYDTGRDGSGMGEGVYVGTAGGLSDRSDQVEIRANTIGPGVGGENVDVKEGTTGTRIVGNHFDGSGLTNANFDDSWVDVKGNGVLVEGNTGVHTLNNGYETHTQQPGWGCGTAFRANTSDLSDSPGALRLAVNVTNYSAATCPTTVYSSNTVTGGKGLTNIPVTP
ncbi:sheath polysaccharide-degrading enzyme, partial [Streptomyces hundungensis]